MPVAEEEWIGVYYPNEYVDNPNSKAIFCLLFDKLICNFPVADFACGGGRGLSEIYDDDPLVKEGIIEVREEILLPEVENNFTPGLYWGTEEEFDKYRLAQVTTMALEATKKNNGMVPVTDSCNWHVPNSVFSEYNFKRYALFQAAALAINSIEISLPSIASISEENILEACYKLRDQLIPFRYTMLKLAPLVRKGIDSDISISEIYDEAKYIVETSIGPTLYELKERMIKEKGSFWTKLIVKGGLAIPKFAFNWMTKDPIKAAIESINDTKDIALDIFNCESVMNSLWKQGGFGYLLKLANYE